MEPKSEVAMVEHANACSDEDRNHDTLAAAEDGGKLDATDELRAIQATLSEHDLTIWEALRLYKKAAMWSMLVSMSIIMRSYDIEITGNFYALPAFQDHLGERVHGGQDMQIPVQWQVAMSVGPIVGQVVGAWLAAIPMDALGRKKTLVIYLLMTSALVFMQVFAPNRTVLTVSMYLAGIIWGGYHVLAPLYASEVLPLRLRGIFVAYVNLCYVMGAFIQTGITRAFVHWDSIWAYKIPYSIQWVWPVFILSFLYWCPESPWWLIRQNRLGDAKKALDRLSSKQRHARNHDILAMMVKTDIYERELQVGATYWDCFKGPNLRRLEICTAVFTVQNFSGNPAAFAVYLFEQTGLSSEDAFDMGIGLNGVGFVGVFCSIFPIIWFGRRRAWLYGLTYNIACLWVVALLCFAPDYKTNHAYSWAQASILITMQLVYSLSVGPLGFVISSEVPSTKLRAKTLALTATFNGMSYLVITVAGPYLLNPGSANAGAKIEFLWGGLSLFSFAWSFFRLPETGDRTYEEIDYLFENHVPTRKFRSYVIDDTRIVSNVNNKE